MYFKPKIHIKRADSQVVLSQMSNVELAAGINNLIQALRDKGVEIADYDDKGRKLYKVQYVHGKLYFLAGETNDR